MRVVWPSPARPASRRAARRADQLYGVPAEPGWRDVDWPAATRTLQIGGKSVNYVELGSGERAVVYVHGLGGCWQNWLENLPATAAAGYRAIALDLPGFGRSAMPDEPITITSYARFLDEFCDALGLVHAAVVGNSMGGFVAAEMGIRHPERVERLVLVDAAGVSTTIGRNPVSERFGKFMATGVIGGGGRAGRASYTSPSAPSRATPRGFRASCSPSRCRAWALRPSIRPSRRSSTTTFCTGCRKSAARRS